MFNKLGKSEESTEGINFKECFGPLHFQLKMVCLAVVHPQEHKSVQPAKSLLNVNILTLSLPSCQRWQKPPGRCFRVVLTVLKKQPYERSAGAGDVSGAALGSVGWFEGMTEAVNTADKSTRTDHTDSQQQTGPAVILNKN